MDDTTKFSLHSASRTRGASFKCVVLGFAGVLGSFFGLVWVGVFLAAFAAKHKTGSIVTL